MSMLLLLGSMADDGQRSDPPAKKCRKKYDMRRLIFTNPHTGVREPYTFHHTLWYCNYITSPAPHNEKWSKLFRTRFRMPYSAFVDLAAQCSRSEMFKTWATTGVHKYNKKETTPLGLLLLCVLRHLGRAWTLDDLEEATACNRETIRKFIDVFLKFGSEVLYSKYVLCPQSSEELKSCEKEYTMAGFPGCIGSTDASHVIIESCPYRLRQLHLGYKLAHTARTYNITVNHRRRILNTTFGHPARFNDKTLVMFDTLINDLKKGCYNERHTFILLDYDCNGKVIEVKYKGCYVLVDNGYLQWSVTVPPMKHTSSRAEIRFSEWLESLRKDVECTFGILKRRWRVLKSGIRSHGLMKCDRTWLTCCALHNMLLDVDGLDREWNNGIRPTTNGPIPNAIEKLNNPSLVRNGDLSGSGYGNDYIPSERNEEMDVEEDTEIFPADIDTNEDGSISITNLRLEEFRRRLVRHFNISFVQHKIVWPKRNDHIN